MSNRLSSKHFIAGAVIISLGLMALSCATENQTPIVPTWTSLQNTALAKSLPITELPYTPIDVDATIRADLTQYAADATIVVLENKATIESLPPGTCPQGCINPPSGCEIKGNISFDTKEKIYHIPSDRFYDQTVINPAYGERWFCTPQEAEANGWRRTQ